jgi:hypothetical protein
MRRLVATISAALVVTLAWLPTVAAATLGSGAVAQLNAQRGANGIPAGLVEDRTLSDDCLAHDHYMALNHTLTHSEIAGNPGYSIGGAYAGQNAMLAQGADWSSGDPYEFAPLHLDQLLAPRLSFLGSADAEGFSCTTTFPGWLRSDPAAVTVYTYPGPGVAIYSSEVARELPWTPGELVGIPQAARTGPNIIVLVDAPRQSAKGNPATLTNATLTGPTGPVTVKTVDGTTALPQGGGVLAGYISPGGFIIPAAPLAAGATYHAHVVVGFAGQQTPHDWSFTTRGKSPQSRLSLRGTSLSFRSRAAQPIQVTFTRAGGAHARGVEIRPGHTARLRLDPGSWQACGTQAAAAGFDSYTTCIALTVTGRPSLRLSAPRISRSQLGLRLHFSAVLRGRPATLTLTPVSVRCTGRRCHTVPGHPTVRTIVLRSASLQVPLPAARHGIQVALTTAAFQLSDAPWTAARATLRYLRP